MAASPQWKVYRGTEYVAACKYVEDAARLMESTGDTIRGAGHKRVFWAEGFEAQPAAESYDYVAETVYERQALDAPVTASRLPKS